MRKNYDPAARFTYATSYCPSCKMITFWPAGREHLSKTCDTILIDITDYEKKETH